MSATRAEVSQVFVSIMAVIVFAVVLLFGYRAITDVIAKGDRVAFIMFKTDLERAVRTVAADYGSVTVFGAQHPLTIPARYRRACFVDLDRRPPASCSTMLSPVICDAWQWAFDSGGYAAGEANMFLEPLGELPIKVVRITLDTNRNLMEDAADAGYLCIPTAANRLDLRIEGRGDHAMVSLP